MRSRRPLAFKPSTSHALEERIVLSDAGLMAPVAAQAASMATTNDSSDVFRFPTELPGRSELLDQLSGRMDTVFASFAEDYRVLRANYIDRLAELQQQPGENDDQAPPTDGSPVATPEGLANLFHEATLERVGELRNQVNSALDEVQGGGGLLNNFGRARVEQLGHELINLPSLGSGPLNSAEYSLLGEYAIADAHFATKQFAEVYDAALFQTASGFFSGNLRFFRGGERPAEQIAELSPAVGPVLEGVYSAFGEFADAQRAYRADYFGALGDNHGDNGANGENVYDDYRQLVADRAEQLRTEAIESINRPAGGAGVLNIFATNQLNHLQQSLANVPDVGSTPLETHGHNALVEASMGRAANDLGAMIQLYDISLFTTAMNFFRVNPRFAGLAGSAQGAGAQATSVAIPGIGTAAQTAGSAQASQVGGFVGGVTSPGFGGVPGVGVPTGLAGGFLSPGVPSQPFFGPRPAGYDPTLGFGGLGNGIVGLGRPVNFGTGFGFGGQTYPGLGPAGVPLGQGLGFGTGGAFGLGNQFGVVAGPGLGTGVGFGGFFI